MTTQNKIVFKDPIVQNLFLLYQNEKFRKDIDQISEKYKSEIVSISQEQNITKFITGQYKSEKLDSEIQKIALNTPLIYGESLTMTKTFIIFTIFGKDPIKTLRALDIKENKLLITPPSIKIEGGPEGTKLEILLSNYHSISDLINLLKFKRKEIEKSQSKWKSSDVKIDKMKAFNLAKDWKIYLKHKQYSHMKVVEKLKLNDVSSSSMVVSRLNKRINSLYP